MGMNRKWNMKVFELHDSQGGGSTITPVDENTNVVVDTTQAEITMQKYPFDDILDEIDSNDILEVNLSSLTANTEIISDILNPQSWKYRTGDALKLNANLNENALTFNSVVLATYDIPTNAQRWVLKFDLKTNPSSYRSFFYFAGVESTETEVFYGYGMDVPNVSNPHLESITSDEVLYQGETISQTVADEQYFTGQDYMPVVLTRWDDTYTLYYDNRYMITIPMTDVSINRIGFYSWGGSNSIIKNPEFYIIESDENAANILINTNTSSIGQDDSDDYIFATFYLDPVRSVMGRETVDYDNHTITFSIYNTNAVGVSGANPVVVRIQENQDLYDFTVKILDDVIGTINLQTSRNFVLDTENRTIREGPYT